MIRRNKRYKGIRYNDIVHFDPSQTSQDEPNLREILIAYSHGDDVSQYIRKPAVQATAEQQFTNRIGKVDFLTEIPDYVKEQTSKAYAAVAAAKKAKQQKQSEKPSTTVEQPSTTVEQPSNNE